MYETASMTNSGALVYFIVLLIVGKYVLLNLFLAVLLDSFSEEGDPDEPEGTPTPSEMAALPPIVTNERFIDTDTTATMTAPGRLKQHGQDGEVEVRPC